MIYRFSIIVFALLFSCSDEQSNTCFKLKDILDKEFFINQSHRSVIKKVLFFDNKEVDLPSQKKYNYLLHSNFIKGNTFLINRIDKDKGDEKYAYCILEAEKSSRFKVLDTICIKGSLYNNQYISSTSLSNDKSKLAIIYSNGVLSNNNRCRLEIVDLINNEVILNYKYNARLFLEQNPWALDDKHIVFYSSLKEVFLFDLESNKTEKVSSNGSKAMWLQPLNKIAYLKERNVIAVYDLTSSLEDVYEVKDKFFYKNFINDYYWFTNQKKFYIKTRFSNLFGDKLVPWKNENYILEYECLK